MLNSKMQNDAFLLHLIEESLIAVVGACWTSLYSLLQSRNICSDWRWFLVLLQQEGLKVKLEKCAFFHKEIH